MQHFPLRNLSKCISEEKTCLNRLDKAIGPLSTLLLLFLFLSLQVRGWKLNLFSDLDLFGIGSVVQLLELSLRNDAVVEVPVVIRFDSIRFYILSFPFTM